MSYGLYLKNALKTVITHNGTKIEYMFPKTKACTENLKLMTKNIGYPNGTKARLDLECNSGKIITFAENSPLRKLGFEQVFLGHNNTTGTKMLSFWQEGSPVKAQVLSGAESVAEIKGYLKVIKELVRSGFKLP